MDIYLLFTSLTSAAAPEMVSRKPSKISSQSFWKIPCLPEESILLDSLSFLGLCFCAIHSMYKICQYLWPAILITAPIVHVARQQMCLCSTNWRYGCITFISNQLETAMTSQGHVTTASSKQTNTKNIKGHFLSAYVSKSSAHPFLKLHILN